MSLFRTLTLIALLMTALPAQAADDEGSSVTTADRAAIEATIRAQIDAFQRDDGEAAFAFAAPAIRKRFRDPETFMAMVRVGYRAVYHPREVRFLDFGPYRGVPTQHVLVIDRDGVPYLAYYMMERQEDGAWRIQGVIIEPAENEDI